MFMSPYVANPNVPGYLCSGLATDASNSMLQRKSSGGKEAGFGAGRAMVAELVQASAARARARNTRQGEAEAPEKQHAEVRRRHDNGRGRGERCEGTGRMGSCLREQKRSRCGVELRKVSKARSSQAEAAAPCHM